MHGLRFLVGNLFHQLAICASIFMHCLALHIQWSINLRRTTPISYCTKEKTARAGGSQRLRQITRLCPTGQEEYRLGPTPIYGCLAQTGCGPLYTFGTCLAWRCGHYLAFSFTLGNWHWVLGTHIDNLHMHLAPNTHSRHLSHALGTLLTPSTGS